MDRLTVRIDRRIAKRLKKHALIERKAIAAVVEQAIDWYIART